MDSSEKAKILENGPAVAALVAAGVGCFTLGLLTVLNEASPKLISPFLNLYNPVGPLSGKSTLASGAYFLSWIVLTVVLRKRDVPERQWLSVAFGLVFLGLVLTFPLVYQIFTVHA